MRSKIFTGICLLTLISVTPAAAQMDFLKTLKEGVGNPLNQGGNTASTGTVNGLTTHEIVAGLREALRVGSQRVVTQIGGVDGFNADPDIHIPLPPQLRNVQSSLKKFGLSALADDLELKLNRAAETAAPKLKDVVWKAINQMSLEDARRIYNGPNDAATQYFKSVSSADLTNVTKPIIDRALKDVGALSAYDHLMGQYRALPFVPDVKADVSSHAVKMTLEGLFHYLAVEEAQIRENPAKRTTQLLSRVFAKP